MVEAAAVDAPKLPIAPEVPVVTREISPLERFIKPALERLQGIQPKDRPGTRAKLPQWLKRCGLCIVREDNVVPMHLLVPGIVKTLGPGLVSDALQSLAGEPVEFGALSVEVIADSALRCAKRLQHQTDFLQWPLDRRDKWIKSQGYASFTTKPEALAAELERLGAVREGPSPQRLTYDEAVLSAPTEAGAAPALPKAAAAMCRVLTVEHIAPGLRASMSANEMQKFKKWLKAMGCRLGPDPRGCLSTIQVTIMAGTAQQSTSVAAAQELQTQLVAELPNVLRYTLGDPNAPKEYRAVDTQTEIDLKMRGFILGKKGEDIKKLEAQHEVRLSHQGGRFTGWISTSLLPDDGTAESLRGLGARLQHHAENASSKLESHISKIAKKVLEGRVDYEKRKEYRKRVQEQQMKDMASTPLKETGQFGAAQEDRDHSRATDARKREQRKMALVARDKRLGPRSVYASVKRGGPNKSGGRHKSGEDRVGREDHADAGQGSGGIDEELRAEWRDPLDDVSFKSQLDTPSLKVPGSQPRHRGHKPGDLRGQGPSSAPAPKRKSIQRGYSDIYEGLGVDASTEEDD